MSNIVNDVNYYIIHKNIDDIFPKLKEEIDNYSIEDLIITQIELLYTDPSNNLVSGLVCYINNLINNELKEISLHDLGSLISLLHFEKSEKENIIKELENEYTDKLSDNKINKLKSEIKSIDIWINNLDNSYNKRIENGNILELIPCYIEELTLINRDNYINTYINKISTKIEDILLKNNLLETITNVMPELDLLYKENSKEKNSVYKLLDYYIDLINTQIKRKINNLMYEEKLILKEKINIICKEILENSNPDDDFKVLVINSYIRYL